MIRHSQSSSVQDIDAGKVEIADLKSPRRHKKRRAPGRGMGINRRILGASSHESLRWVLVQPTFLTGRRIGFLSTSNWGELTHLGSVAWATKYPSSWKFSPSFPRSNPTSSHRFPQFSSTKIPVFPPFPQICWRWFLYFPNGKVSIWGIYRGYFLVF